MSYATILGSTASTASSTILPATYPGTVAAGKLIYAGVSCFGGSTFTPAGGWLEAKRYVFGAGANNVAFLLYKVSDGTETGAFNLTFSANNRKAGVVFSTTADVTDLISAGSKTVSTNTLNHDQITPLGIDRLIVYLYACADAAIIDPATVTPYGTAINEAARNTSNSVYVGLGYEQHPTATLTPLRASSSSVTLANIGQFVFAIALSIPAIVEINGGDEELIDGQAEVLIEHANFGTITGVTLKATDGGSFNFSQSLSFANGDPGETLFDMPNVSGIAINTAGVPFSESFTLSLEITDGTATASQEITLVPAAGYELFETLDAQTGLGFIFNGFETPIPDGTPVLYPTAGDTTLTAAGGIESNLPVDSIITVKIFDLADGMWRVHSVMLVDEDGGGPVWMGMGFIEFIQPIGFIG